MRFAITSAALVASASTALAVGSANIVNNCPYDVTVVSVSNEPGKTNTLHANGGSYSEQFRENPNGGGISLKVAKAGSGGLVSQFEYTYNPPTNAFPGVFWDLSLIDGNVFKDTAVSLVPKILSGNPGGSCNAVNCPAGANCKDAYNQPWENAATHQCPADTDLTYNLCSSGNGGSSGSGSSAPASSPAPSPAPSPSPAPKPASSPAPSPAPASSPAPSAPAPQQLNQVAKPASSAAPAPSPAPTPAHQPYVISWEEGGPLQEISVKGKREAGHANHIERHNRIRRMHHARSMA